MLIAVAVVLALVLAGAWFIRRSAWRAPVVMLLALVLVMGTAVASWAPPIRGGGTQNGVVNPDPKRYPNDHGGGTMDPNPKRYPTHN